MPDSVAFFISTQQVRVIWWEQVPPLHSMEMALSVVVNA